VQSLQEFHLSDSIVHRLDPRAKIILTAMFSIVTAVSGSITVSLVALCGGVILSIIASVPFKPLIKRIALVNGFILFLWIFLPLTYPGDTILKLGPVALTREGLLYAALITLKSNAILLVVISLLGASSVFALVHALHHLAAPDKLIHLFFFCYRYIHVIMEEYNRLKDAARVRGFKPGFNAHTYKTYAYFVGMMLVRSYDRSARILAAMKCRGFKGKFYILHHYGMGNNDYAFSAVTTLFIASLALMSWGF
jgi:cobalt/nickel transport system permease protein